jgi:DNA adenine methylase
MFEPFAGSLAVLLNRPHPPHIETVNDICAFIANVFRALRADPDGVAAWCDRQPNEADLHAIHTWLVGQREAFTARLMGDPDYYDAKVAGRWLYGIACWIGGGWCSGNGAWQSVEGQLRYVGSTRQGIKRALPHLGDAGRGVHRQPLRLNHVGQGVYQHLDDTGQGRLASWFAALQARLRYVRICCGDWSRVLGPSVTFKNGLTGILLDPPYSLEEDRDMRLYTCDDGAVAHAVREWCVDNGDNPLLRIAFCAYGEVHDELLSHGWRKIAWKAHGGMGSRSNGRGRANSAREVVYFSPHCLTPQQQQLSLFT